MHSEPETNPERPAQYNLGRLTAPTSEPLSEAARLRRLLSVVTNLGRALTPDDAAEVMLTDGLAVFGADSGVICLLTPDQSALRLVQQVGLHGEVASQFSTFPIESPVPIAEAVRTGQSIFLSNREEVAERYPALRDVMHMGFCRAWIAAPLHVDGRALGGFGFGYRDARTFTDDDRQFVDAIAIQCSRALDRTQLYQREHVLRERAEAARVEAEAANRVKSEFLATMSHELRTPLNAIGGYAELLELGVHGPLSAEQQEDITRIRRSQRHLLSLIEDLLNFTRLEAGQLTFDIGEVAVDEPLLEVEMLITPQLRAKGLQYEYKAADRSVRVRADRDKVKQILVNLLTNAIKFTETGGSIQVYTSVAPDRVFIHVGDTGCGIPAEKVESIFEPFVQLDSSLTRTNQGSGLGLSISRNLARGMEGDLLVESTPGKGSTFTLGLPRVTLLSS